MGRTTVSSACACAGVLLLILAGVAPDDWQPTAALSLFAGLALLVVSHVLTPCLDRIAVWRKQLLK